jgi:hypothetical protein
MLDALKMLDARAHEPVVEPPKPTPPLLAPWEAALDETESLLEQAELAVAPRVIEKAPPLPVRAAVQSARVESCSLPIAPEPADYYHEMATRIGDQLAGNYSNVLLFVASDRWVEPNFSMTQLAQCFALQSSGDVLLVDGDLRTGRLSKSVARPGPGMVEAMLGAAQWPDIIHPTNVARIDFVARGNGQVPTFERPQFGWGALRPLYRAVLIGLAGHAEPETAWLAGRCDAVYYVLSRPHTRRANGSATVNALRASGANVAGCIVVND